MGVRFAGQTDVGRKREHNEDSLLVAPHYGLMVVADGMGGHQAGEVASNICVSTMDEFFRSLSDDEDVTWPYRMDRRFDAYANRLVVSIQWANQRIRETGRDEGKQGLGTTCVSALVVGNIAYYAWVGDSRGYLLRRGQFRQITSDHSLQNELLLSGRLRPEDAARFQHKNVITRALGMANRVEVDVSAVDLEPGDVLLICSDGLTGMVDDARISQILGEQLSLENACRRLIEAANAAGGVDNISVALAQYDG